MLYALRYEKHTNNAIDGLVDALKHRGVPEDMTKVSTLLTFFINMQFLLFSYPPIAL
jgi:hypothetical protein